MNVDGQGSDQKAAISSPVSDVPQLVRESTLECAICLQPCLQPVKLPCSHTFCFLCVKGIALQRRPCALCRTDIPPDFLTKPGMFQAISSKVTGGNVDSERQVWYYQGHKGWWQYDERTSADIEEAYSKKEKSVDILIAGSIYVIDFENMIQFQRFTNSRKRKIKRDSVAAEKKGVAGMTETGGTKPGGAPQGLPSIGQSTSNRQLPYGSGGDGTVPSNAAGQSPGNG